MAKELYNVCLTGKLLTGHNRREVTVNLAQLVGTSIPQAAQLLDAAPCLKAQVDQFTAAYYHEILEETGAEVAIRACLAHTDQHPRALLGEDDPEFDLPALPTPALVSVPPAAPVPPGAPPQLQPEQAIAFETTPVLEDLAEPEPIPAAAEATEPEDPQDITQPFAVPPPAQRARRRWPLWLGGTLLGLAGLAGALVWLLPAPLPPGHAIAQVGESLNLAQPFQQQVEHFWQAQGRPPTSQDLQWPGPQALGSLGNIALQAQGTLVITYHQALAGIAGQTLELQPQQADQGFEWRCSGGTLSLLQRPLECRPQVIKSAARR